MAEGFSGGLVIDCAGAEITIHMFVELVLALLLHSLEQDRLRRFHLALPFDITYVTQAFFLPILLLLGVFFLVWSAHSSQDTIS